MRNKYKSVHGNDLQDMFFETKAVERQYVPSIWVYI